MTGQGIENGAQDDEFSVSQYPLGPAVELISTENCGVRSTTGGAVALVWGATDEDQRKAVASLRRDSRIFRVDVGDRIRVLQGETRPDELAQRPDAIRRAKWYGWEWAIFGASADA